MPELPTCDCISGFPPFDRLTFIYQAAAELSGDDTLPSADCVAGVPPFDRFAYIYAAFRVIAEDDTLPSQECVEGEAFVDQVSRIYQAVAIYAGDDSLLSYECVRGLPIWQQWREIYRALYVAAGSPDELEDTLCINSTFDVLSAVYCAILQNNIPCVTPVLVTATIDGGILTLVFSEKVTGHEGFAITIEGMGTVLTYQSGEGTNTLIFESSPGAVEGDLVEGTYSPGDVTNRDCPLETINLFEVANNTEGDGIEFSLVQEVHTSAGSATTAEINLDQPITAGNLIVIAVPYTAFNVEVLSVDKGGVLVSTPGTSGGAGFQDSSGSVGYILSADAATSPITLTFNGTTGGCAVSLWEFAPTGGAPALAGANRFSNPSGATAQGPTFTLPDGNCLIVHTSVQTGSALSITDPYNPPTGESFFPDVGYAAQFNATDGTGPTWTYSGSSDAGMSAVVFALNPPSFLTQAFCDFEGGVNGADVTPANLLASTRGWTAGRWKVQGTGAAMKFSTNASKPLLNATGRLNNGVSYPAGAGSLGVEFLTSTVQSYIMLDYAASAGAGSNKRNSTSFSFGFWFQSNIPNNDASNLDVGSLYAAGGTGFLNFKYRQNAGGTSRCAELEIPGGSSGATVNLTSAGAPWYWVTGQYNEVDPHKLRFYDASMTLVGELIEAHTGTGIPGNVQLGQSSSNTPTTGFFCRFDSLKVDPTGTYPLLP